VPSRRQAVKVHCGAISEEEYPDVGRVVFTPTGVRTSEVRVRKMEIKRVGE